MAREFTDMRRRLPRRRFLTITAGGAAAVLVGAGCGDDDDDDDGEVTTTPTEAPATASPTEEDEASPTATSAAAGTGRVVVGDVLDHALSSDEWSGDFGHVTFRLHEGMVDGEPIYFIRTDTSDADFAESEGLVHVPLLANAVGAPNGLSSIYLFEDAPEGQSPVLSTGPHMDDFSPAFLIHRVTMANGTGPLESVDDIAAAEEAGDLSVETTEIVVNYPVVKWPGGELPHDEVREGYLGDGQLLEPVNVEGGEVTFKLHSCYPNSRYIVTDVTMPPMAEGMNIAPAPAAAGLMDAGATAKILVFGNGPEGSGPMGGQKSVTDTVVGDAAWSPFWDHYTFVWGEDAAAGEVLRSENEILQREEAGELERFAGTPDTGGELFMVNCPVPVVAQVE